jgi:hypothetical protein
VKRKEIFDTSASLISGERQATYGTAKDNFTSTANLWEAVLGVSVSPEQFAICMALVKIDRLRTSPDHEDSWVDAVSYLVLGGEIATGDG